jgi:hypothetical protein
MAFGKDLARVLRRGDVSSPLMTFGGGAHDCGNGSMDALLIVSARAMSHSITWVPSESGSASASASSMACSSTATARSDRCSLLVSSTELCVFPVTSHSSSDRSLSARCCRAVGHGSRESRSELISTNCGLGFLLID